MAARSARKAKPARPVRPASPDRSGGGTQAKPLPKFDYRAVAREFVGADELAYALGCCKATVLRHIHLGLIPAVRPDTPGGKSHWRIDKEWVLAYLRGEVGLVPHGRTKRKRSPAETRTLPLPFVGPPK